MSIAINGISKNTILYGVSGTGKTYTALIYAAAIIEGRAIVDVENEIAAVGCGEVMKRFRHYCDRGLAEFVTFHPSYGYGEFVEGLRPPSMHGDNEHGESAKHGIHDGVFKSFCNRKPRLSDEERKRISGNRVFIIDNINRGNISEIFGELVTLIEPNRRIGAPEELKVRLPYSGKDFAIAGNIYIIGTMNTADREDAAIDTALRRRFRFIEMLPRPELLKDVKVENINIGAMLDIINKRLILLYDRDHIIGHSYFMPLRENPTIECLGEIFKNDILPLLQDYFFEDFEKIRIVLGDNQKRDFGDCFIVCQTLTQKQLGNIKHDYSDDMYITNNDAFFKIKAYEHLNIKSSAGQRQHMPTISLIHKSTTNVP